MTQDFKERLELIERNLRYLIELDLSDDGAQQDKLAMAFFYHFITKNRIQSLNISSLKGWARSFTYETIVEKKLTKKKDTEITAAILAYSTLKYDKSYPKEKKQEIETKIPVLLKKELAKGNLFFNRSNFTAMILYATQIAGFMIDNEETITRTLIEKYQNLDEFSNISGVPFLIAYLLKTGQSDIAKAIIDKAGNKIESHSLNYDDALYLTHALYQYHEKADDLLKHFETIKKTIKETPIMISDIINKGDISDITVRDENRTISRLYKAIFLDLLEGVDRHIESLEQKELDKRYSSETSYEGAAFFGYTLLCTLPAVLFSSLFKNRLIESFDFWILKKTAVSWKTLIANTTITFVDVYLILFAAVGIFALYKIIIKEKINKDLRIRERFWIYQKSMTKWFLISIVGLFILEIIATLLTGSFQDFLKGKNI